MTSLTAAQLAAIKTCWADLQAFWETCDCVPTFRFAMVRGWEAGFAFQTARLAEAEQTIVQRVATIHGLSTIIDGHEAEMEDLAQRCDKAVADLAAAQATIERLTKALEEFASWSNWHVKTEGYGPTVRRDYGWDGGGDPMDMASAALAPPAPEADDAR